MPACDYLANKVVEEWLSINLVSQLIQNTKSIRNLDVHEIHQANEIEKINEPGLAESRSDKIDVGGFDTFGIFGIVTGTGCDMPGETIAFGGDVISDSLVGVTFFLRARFFAAGSSKSSGGLPNSDGSKSLVFCTSKTVDGIICSRFWPRPRMLDIAFDGIGGSIR